MNRATIVSPSPGAELLTSTIEIQAEVHDDLELLNHVTIEVDAVSTFNSPLKQTITLSDAKAVKVHKDPSVISTLSRLNQVFDSFTTGTMAGTVYSDSKLILEMTTTMTGTRLSDPMDLSLYTNAPELRLYYVAETPGASTVAVGFAVTDTLTEPTSFSDIQSDGSLGLMGMDLAGKYLWLKYTLTRTVPTEMPAVSEAYWYEAQLDTSYNHESSWLDCSTLGRIDHSSIEWSEYTETGTSALVETRTSTDATIQTATDWVLVSSGGGAISQTAPYVQYRVRLTGTSQNFAAVSGLELKLYPEPATWILQNMIAQEWFCRAKTLNTAAEQSDWYSIVSFRIRLPLTRTLYTYHSTAKRPPIDSGSGALYLYKSIVQKPLVWSGERGLYQYQNIAADPPIPWIEKLSVSRGPIGSNVTIYGSGFGFTNLNDFENADRFLRGYGGLVFLGTASCGIVEWSWNKIVFQIPIGSESGAVKVRLTVPYARDSNVKGFEIYEGIPGDDIGIELFVCERTSPNLIVRQLEGAWGKAFQMIQNNPGSGNFKISRLDDAGGNRNYITEENFILVKLDGQPLFKWVIESVKPNYVDGNEQQIIEVSGRGVLSLLNRAVVYPESLGAPDLDRHFTGTASTVLRTLILEAQRRGGLPDIEIGWEDDQDSIGNIFTEEVNMSFHVGTPLSEVVSKFTEGLGYFDITISPSLKIQIFKERGSDLHDDIVYRPGQAILKHQHQIDTSNMVNEVLIEGGDKKLAIASHPNSSAKFGRREGYLSANNVRTGLSEYGEAYLERMALPMWGIQGTVTKFYDHAGRRLKPFESFSIGDWIGWNIPPEGSDTEGFNDKVKVRGITVSENDETGALEYTLDLNNTMLEHEIKMNQKVERFTQFSGSDVLSNPSSSSDGYSESEVNQLLQNKANKIHQHLFTDLADVPDSYSGQGEKLIAVNEEGTGLEFKTILQATNETLGLIKAKIRTTETVEVAIDGTSGKLYVPTYTSGDGGSDTGVVPGVLLKAEELAMVLIGTGSKTITTVNLTPDVGTALQYGGGPNSIRTDTFSFTCGDGNFYIWYGAETESGYDYGYFYLDGISFSGQIQGVNNIRFNSVLLSAGTHEFKVTYRKDGSGNTGYDGIRIYAIKYPSIP